MQLRIQDFATNTPDSAEELERNTVAGGDTPETVGELPTNDAPFSAAEALAKAAPSW